jgi:glycosyltransferase involved in cell wall biosynthesis
MKRILVDGLGFDPIRQGGGATFFQNLIQSLLDIDLENHYTVLLSKGSESYLKFEPRVKIRQIVLPFRVGNLVTRLFFQQLIMPLWAAKYDILFSPFNYTTLLWPKSLLLVVHDYSSPFYRAFFPKYLPKYKVFFDKFVDLSVKRATAVVAVSKFTKFVITARGVVDETKLQVIYEGIDETIYRVKARKNKSKHKFVFLFVGTLSVHKNLITLIKGLEILFQRNSQLLFELRLVGRPGFGAKSLMDYIEQSPIRSRIQVFGYVTDHELHRHYIQSDILVLPSVYEGFGLPVLEALKYGITVVASFATAIPEVGMSNVIYFNPYDEQDLAAKLTLALNRVWKIDWSLIKQNFSWKVIGRRYLNVLNSL